VRGHGGWAFAVVAICCPESARAQDTLCGKTPEFDSRLENLERWKGDLEGRAQALARFLGTGELSGKIETERRELYKSSDRAEAARADAYLTYLFCVTIMNDRSLSTADKLKVIQEFRRPPPLGLQLRPPSSRPHTADTSPTTSAIGQTPSPSQVQAQIKEPQAGVCVTACLTPAQWAACPTKSWWADSKDHRFRTPRFFHRCGTVCRPPGSVNLGYLASDGGWVVFKFPKS
jgi:hypothetical protein